MLDRMYSSKKSLEDILTRKAIKALIDQYQETFDEICKKNITPMLNACVQEIFECLTCSTMNIYAHSFEEQQEEVATKVNEFLRLNA